MQRAPFLWEQHCCLPLSPTAQVGELARYLGSGGSFASANVGYSPHSYQKVLTLLRAFRAAAEADPRLRLAATTADIDAAQQAGQVAVAFDLEDSGPLEGRPDRIDDLYELGVRTMLLTYNHRNAAGGGCLDPVDEGLTDYGRTLIRRMNDVGMVVDGSHCGTRSAREATDLTRAPMVYSHSCMRGVWDHPRNITDDQARACAATGGVIGITGVGVFLGPNDATIAAMCRHIEYALDLVGPEHVGVSTDFNFDYADFLRQLRDYPHLFPESFTRWGPVEFVAPEALLTIGDALRARGHSDEVVTAVMGGNFRRVADQVWRAGSAPDVALPEGGEPAGSDGNSHGNGSSA